MCWRWRSIPISSHASKQDRLPVEVHRLDSLGNAGIRRLPENTSGLVKRGLPCLNAADEQLALHGLRRHHERLQLGLRPFNGVTRRDVSHLHVGGGRRDQLLNLGQLQ